MRKKQKIRWRKGLAFVLAAVMAVPVIPVGSGNTVWVQAAAGDTQPPETTDPEPEPAAEPVITGQPQDITAAYGYQNLTMTVEIANDSNYTYSYQWYENAADSNSGGTSIQGATSFRLAIPGEKAVGTVYYYCVVTAERKDNQEIKAETASRTAKFTVTKADRTIVIDSLDKTFDKAEIADPEYTIYDKEGNEVSESAGPTITYYKDSNNSLGNKMNSKPSEPGTYWVKVEINNETNYKNVSGEKKFEISYLKASETSYTLQSEGTSKKGWYQKAVTIKPAQGYKIAKDSYNNPFEESITVSDEGEQEISVYLQSTNGQITDKISVPVKIDGTEPTGTIQVSQNAWKTFLSDITFGLFFKNTQNVVISGEDTISGVKSISYLISSEIISETQIAAEDKWTVYNGNLSLNPEEQYIVYAKIEDNAGNIKYLCSDGMVFDSTAPTITGIQTNENYYGEVTFTVEDANLLNTIKFDTVDLITKLKNVGNTYQIVNDNNIPTCEITLKAIQDNKYTYTVKATGNDRHRVEAKDKAGNNKSVDYFGIYKAYTVTYKYKDSSETEQVFKTQQVNFDGYAVKPTTEPEKTGHVFTGWIDPDTNQTFDFSTKITGDLTLTAGWKKAVYKVSFDSRGGSACNDMNVTYGEAFGTMGKPTRAGYEFQGWYTSEAAADNTASSELTEYNGTLDGKVTAATTVGFTKNIKVYARWTESNYKVRFQGEGGTIKELPSSSGNVSNYDKTNHILTVTYSKPYGDLPDAEKPGYEFQGWYTDKNGGNKVESSANYQTAGDTTVYAHWQEKSFRVTLDFNYTGHVPSTAPEPSPETITVVYNDTYHALPEKDPERPGYTFQGWYTKESESEGRKVTVDTIVKIEANTTLYAQWRAKTYSLSFDADGGSECSSRTVTYGEAYGTLPATTKTGYIFTGWYLPSASKKVESTDKIEITENTTLTAVWEPCKSKVILNANHGKFKSDDSSETEQKEIEAVYDKKYSECGLNNPDNTPERTGYTFAGWYTEEAENAGTKVEGTEEVKITDPINLYAHWTANTYQVAFHVTAGDTIIPPAGIDSGSYDKQKNELTVTYDKNYETLPIAERTGYTFAGWYTEETENTGTEIKADTKVAITEKQSLYAHWTPKQYVVALNPNGGSLIDSSGTAIPAAISVTYQDTYRELSGKDPTRKGYVFAGWHTKSDSSAGDQQITSTDTVEITAGITLYAHWTPAELTFTDKTLDAAVYGQSYDVTLGEPEGGTGSYRYQVKTGSSLPAGLSLTGNRLYGVWKEDVTTAPFEFTVIATDQDSAAYKEAKFSITAQKGEQIKPSKPEVSERTSTSITLKSVDGMEYCKMNAQDTDLEKAVWKTTTKFTGLDPGQTYDFYARWAGKTNYNPSPASDAASIATRRICTVTVPDAAAQESGHYKLTPVSTGNEVEEGGSYTFQIEFLEGYSKTGSFVVAAQGTDQKREKATVNPDGSYTITNIQEDKKIIVEGVGDTTSPTGTITVSGEGGGSWSSFLRNITFTRFFKAAPAVTITGADTGSGVASVSYYVAGENEVWDEYRMHTENISWTDGGTADLSGKEGKVIVYARIKDQAGNSTYLRSDGIVIDTKAPEIAVIAEDGTETKVTSPYTETVLKDGFFTVADENLSTVTVDGTAVYAVGGKYSIPADSKGHTVTAADQAGNITTVSIQLDMKSYTVKFLSEGSLVDSKTVIHNQTTTAAATPTKAGAIFYGWYQGETAFDFSTLITQDMELEAKWVKDNASSKVSEPIAKEVSKTRVVLQKEEGCQYRMNWGEPMETVVFTGLVPGKEYYFYKINEKGEESKPLKVKTLDILKCGMTALPSTLYQGEAYEIEPTVAMAGLVNNSPDPENTYIVWRVNKPDIVSISNESITGCTLSVNNVPYNKNRLTKVTLTATVGYVQLRNGELVRKTKEYRKSFNVQNLASTISFDLSDLSTEPAETGAFVSGSAIYLMDKKGITLKSAINDGMEGNLATNQKLKWFISDENGKINSKGRKIASISSKGVLKGVRPGTTYVTVATVDSYKKATKSYLVFATYQVVCPWVEQIAFDSTAERVVKAGEATDLSSILQYTPENVFNQSKMRMKWKSSDTGTARVTQKGKVTFKKAGTVTITCTPTGGQKIEAATGKVSDSAKDMKAEITFTIEP